MTDHAREAAEEIVQAFGCTFSVRAAAKKNVSTIIRKHMDADRKQLAYIVDRWGEYLDIACGPGRYTPDVPTGELIRQWDEIRSQAALLKEVSGE